MPLRIERLEVQEGFLDGLDLRFTPGLNVLIGPRGSGKTSVIELIRFGLGVRGYTTTTDERARSHVASVLQSGRVTITLASEEEEVVITRAAEEEAPRVLVSGFKDQPIILSQGEVERLALDPAGRLRLLDGFRSRRADIRSEESGLLTRISSLTVEMADLGDEIAKRQDEVQILGEFHHRLSEAEKVQEELAKKVAGLKNHQAELERLSAAIAETSAQETILQRNIASLQDWLSGIDRILAFPPMLESWTEPGASDPVSPAARDVASAIDSLRAAAQQVRSAIDLIEQQRATGRESERENRDAARDLRRKLESAQAGAGQAARDVAELRERVARLEAINRLIASNQERVRELQRLRGDLLDELDRLRADKFRERVDVAEGISTQLRPQIDVQVTRFGLYDEYASSVAAMLRGSQLQYNVLAYRIANAMSPREFVETIESGGELALARATEIEDARAARVVAHLTGKPLHEILSSRLEDSVELRLLDGEDYRPTEQLSTGQRCTVILPVLLLHQDRPIVVDQPEDNLDNAFVVETLVKAIRSRSPSSQLIFATHNPNIPVLGEATKVVLMSSDGVHGFWEEQGALEEAPIVRAITDVMEGGAEAFRLRAAFYSKSATNNEPS